MEKLVGFVGAHGTLAVLFALAGAAVMILWRFQETRTPVSPRKIIIPPMGMATGFSMFFAPATRVPAAWALAAFALGALVFSVPLVRSSALAREAGAIVMRRSRAFLWLLLGMVAVRFGVRAWVEQYVTPVQTGALLFVLAFGAVLRWRVQMFLQYRRMVAQPQPAAV
jgi:membrane protein CcdC involved in cytochrome C biogenesis